MNGASKLTTGMLALAMLGVSSLSRAQEDAPSKGLVLVQRTINTRYAEAVNTFSALLQSTLTKPYVVKQQDTLQKIVSDKYSMGPTATPELYQQMATRIQALNDLPSPDAIPAGKKLSLPDIPPVQWKKPNPNNPNYGFPRLHIGPTYAEVLAGRGPSSAAKYDWRNIFDKGRKAEPLVSQWRWLTVEEAKAEAESMGEVDAITNNYWSQPLTLKFAQAPAASPQSPAVAADLQYLSALINRRQPQRDVVVYVLDDSWPSQASFDASRAFLVDALESIRKAFFIPEKGLPPALRDASAKTDFPSLGPQKPLHATLIESSLADFRKLTPRVKVIYLPLFTQQKWAKELWEEMTYTALVASALHSKLGVIAPSDSEVLAPARAGAAKLVGQIPTKIVDSLGPAQQTPITVLQKIAQLYSMTTGVPFFISMSWTVEKREIDFGPDPDALGVSLAATGNDDKDVIGNAVYLAYRAKAAPGDVLAVMNTDGNGQELCKSSRLPLTGTNPFYGLAYDGTFAGGSECGTSFSAPRVAWLLALRQAYNAPIGKAGWPDWYASFRTGVLSLQSPSQTTSRRYWLPVGKLFDGL